MAEQKPILEKLAEVNKAIVILTEDIDNNESLRNNSSRLILREYILECDELLKRTSREGTLNTYRTVNIISNAARGLLRYYFQDYVTHKFIEPPRNSVH